MYRMWSLTWIPKARNRGIDQLIGSRMGPDPAGNAACDARGFGMRK